jgi:D-sedoheptulose 7-phosphate isomerase
MKNIISIENINQFFLKKKLVIFTLFKNLKFEKSFYTLCNESIKAIVNGKKIIFFGNGGSAADAQHLATELTVRFKKNRIALPAIALTTDTSALTAIGNDLGFKYIFSRQLEAIGRSGDICIAITTSGNSPNLIEAIRVANKKKLKTFCFSGNNGGKIKKNVSNSIIVPSFTTAEIQVVQIFIGQIFCEILEDFFYKKKFSKK